MTAPTLVALDLEGVLLHEVWFSIADATGIEELRLTTRDIADYDELMRMRLGILNRHNLTLSALQSMIRNAVTPMEGAVPFLNWVRQRSPVVILSDIFMEFVSPVLAQLEFPTILGNTLSVDPATDMITAYHIRQPDGKRRAIEAFHGLGYRIFAAGDSYNDLAMIQTADFGALFRAPSRITEAHSEITACTEYRELQDMIENHLLT